MVKAKRQARVHPRKTWLAECFLHVTLKARTTPGGSTLQAISRSGAINSGEFTFIPDPVSPSHGQSDEFKSQTGALGSGCSGPQAQCPASRKFTPSPATSPPESAWNNKSSKPSTSSANAWAANCTTESARTSPASPHSAPRSRAGSPPYPNLNPPPPARSPNCWAKRSGTCEIARTLGISAKTIESHREHIKAKLNLASGAALNRCAILWLETGHLI
jgi:hypothetical protein